MPFALAPCLPRWGVPPDAPSELINVSENLTYRVEAPGRRPFVVRVHRPHYHDLAEIRSEVAWITALRAQAIVDTPAPLLGIDGEIVQELGPSPDGVVRCAVGYALIPGCEPKPDMDLPAWFGRLGALTARLHDHARTWTRPPAFRRKTWDWNAMFGPGAYWGDWRCGVGLDRAGTILLGRAIDLVGRRMEAFGCGPDQFGLIHADLRLANLLVDSERLQVLDFDDCGFGWFLYDFASAVSFFEDDPIVDTLREAWVDGYRVVRALSPADVAELPVFIAMRRFLLVAWIASHPEVQIARELGADYTSGALAMAETLLSTFA